MAQQMNALTKTKSARISHCLRRLRRGRTGKKKPVLPSLVRIVDSTGEETSFARASSHASRTVSTVVRGALGIANGLRYLRTGSPNGVGRENLIPLFATLASGHGLYRLRDD